MGYELHIERDGGIPIDEWKQAVSSVRGIRLDSSIRTLTNPKTGQRITVSGRDGDVAVELDGTWVNVFGFFNGRVNFKAGPVAIDDPQDPVARVAFKLAKSLSAKIVGDDGEEYEYPAATGEAHQPSGKPNCEKPPPKKPRRKKK